jgi:hypothetical protein
METTIQLIAHILLILKQVAVVMEVRNLRTLAAMIALLMKGKRARLYELARALPGGGNLESRAQKLRRWVSNVHISASDCLPSYLNLLAPVLTTQPSLTLILDRTSWTRLGGTSISSCARSRSTAVRFRFFGVFYPNTARPIWKSNSTC